MAVDVITSRHLHRRREPALLRRLRARHAAPAGRDAARVGRRAGHRRRRQGLPLHQQPGHRHRRRHRDGLACRLPRGEHGVRPVPPDLPVPPAGAQLPDHRGAARRGRAPAAAATSTARRALHARARPARRTRAARHRRARDRLRDEKAWPGPCVARRHAPRRGLPARAFPDHPRALPAAAASTSRGNRSPWCRRRTTAAAASSPTWTAAPTCPGCTRSARPATPACTARTGWRATRCSSAWSSGAAAPSASCNRPSRRRKALPAWDESQVEDADEQVVIAHNWDELRLMMWNYVGIVRTTRRLERALHRIELLQERDLRVLRELPRHARPARAAQPGRLRRTDRALGAGAPRKPRPALQPRLSGHVAGEFPDGADAARAQQRTRRTGQPQAPQGRRSGADAHRVVDRAHVLRQPADRDAVDAGGGDARAAGRADAAGHLEQRAAAASATARFTHRGQVEVVEQHAASRRRPALRAAASSVSTSIWMSTPAFSAVARRAAPRPRRRPRRCGFP